MANAFIWNDWGDHKSTSTKWMPSNYDHDEKCKDRWLEQQEWSIFLARLLALIPEIVAHFSFLNQSRHIVNWKHRCLTYYRIPYTNYTAHPVSACLCVWHLSTVRLQPLLHGYRYLIQPVITVRVLWLNYCEWLENYMLLFRGKVSGESRIMSVLNLGRHRGIDDPGSQWC